jgi:hypothetical protein
MPPFMCTQSILDHRPLLPVMLLVPRRLCPRGGGRRGNAALATTRRQVDSLDLGGRRVAPLLTNRVLAPKRWFSLTAGMDKTT